MMWCAVASSWLAAARTATVLPTPTSLVMTPRSDSPMQKRIRATASWWLARSHSRLAGMVLLNGVRVKPKWLTQGARVMTAGPGPHHAAGRGRRSGRAVGRHAPLGPGPGNRCRWMVAEWVAGLAVPGGARAAQ